MARNANGTCGLWDFMVIGIGGQSEYGRLGLAPPVFSWLDTTGRGQDGFHLRRGWWGQVFYPGAPMVAETTRRRLKTG